MPLWFQYNSENDNCTTVSAIRTDRRTAELKEDVRVSRENRERVLGPYRLFTTAISRLLLYPHTSHLAQQQTIAAHLTFRGDIFRSLVILWHFVSCRVAPPPALLYSTHALRCATPDPSLHFTISISPEIEFYRQVIVAFRIEISLFVVMILFSWDFTFTKLFVNFHL